MDAAVAGLIGVAIGAISSLGVSYLQQRQQSRHERLKMAVELAMHDQERDVELAKSGDGPALIPPPTSYVIYHVRVLKELSAGDIRPEKLKKLSEKHTEILQAFPGAPSKL
jgi:HAMP domain-containing protein